MAKFETALEQENLQALSGDVTAEEWRDYGYVALRVRPATEGVSDALQSLNIELPDTLQMTGSLDSRLVKWISPDEFLVTLPLAEKDDFVKQAEEAFAGIFAAVVDNSGGYSLLKFSGSQYPELMAKLCLYDLKRNFPKGKVISTFLGKAPAILYRVDDDSLMCMVRWSFAAYAWQALTHASEGMDWQPA